jgi:hypothetical protein
MQYIFRYNLRPDGAADYHRWLSKQADASAQPAGWTYVGTWLDVMGFGHYDYESRWVLDAHGSVASRPLDEEAEKDAAAALPFLEDGQVLVLKGLSGIPARAG